MENTPCPHCGKNTISALQRFKAEHWATIECPECSGRVAMQPLLMALLYFSHTWNIFFFGFMAIYDSSLFYGSAMVVGWLLLEFFGYYIPLVRLKRLKPIS